MIGTKVAHYEITAHLGSGGMGDVYQATDTKLGRSVAIKFLPEAFSHDTERVARFQREARVLASLNHSNIAVIHGVEEIDGRHFLVMELILGETLAHRIKRGAIPLEEALPIAKQIAEALEEAHERGVVHRDLKPANIKVTQEGKVKVLDFGLAKAWEVKHTDVTASNSPTLSMAATNAGVILGTPAYMSPEQARGKQVDRRADIWAFGVVLYELLSGQPPFAGNTTTDILAAVVRADPDFNTLPADTPTSIRRLLKRCLEKDRKKRLPDIGVARLEIDESAIPDVVTTPPVTVKRSSMLAWLVAATAVFALAIVSWYAFRTKPESHWTGTRLSSPTVVAITPRVSPDGQLLAFLAMVEGQTQVAVMKPDTGNSTVLTHDRTRGVVSNMSWSRDGARIYFDRDDAPKAIFSVPVLGGDEQLVIEDAAAPETLPDGSLLIQRFNSDKPYLIHRFEIRNEKRGKEISVGV